MSSVSAEAGGPLPVAVVGGGVSGLSLAYFLTRAGCPVELYEATDQLGGNIRTESHDGFTYDVGPDSFLRTKPHAVELCRALGLEDELIVPRPEGQRVFVAHDGVLHPMPEGLSLGVPTNLSGLLDTSLLSGLGKLRAMCEPFISERSSRDETIFDFARRRLGAEMAERIVAPLLAGVFAGDARELGIEEAFPQLVAMERNWGSLFRGMTRGQPLWKVALGQSAASQSPFVSLRGGLARMIESLTDALPEGVVRRRSVVERIDWSEEDTVNLEGHREGTPFRQRARHVAIAGPPWAAASLLATPAQELARELDGIRGCPTATVFFGLDSRHMERTLEGSGFIVPPGEGDILAATWISSKWEARAPEGACLVRAFVGGARGADNLLRRDDELVELARRELTRLMGPLGPVRFARAFRYRRGTPQPTVGNGARLERVQGLLRSLPHLTLLGSGYGGVGIPDCVRQAKDAAEKLAAGDPSRG